MLRQVGWIGLAALLALGAAQACGDDDGNGDGGVGGSAAVKRGVGAACDKDADCTETGQKCLPFKGGYCGIEGCTADADCPDGSKCVTHTDNENYCFLVCKDKVDCNLHRPVEAEANCVSSIVFVEPDSKNKKACEPPTGSQGGSGGAVTGGAGGGGAASGGAGGG